MKRGIFSFFTVSLLDRKRKMRRHKLERCFFVCDANKKKTNHKRTNKRLLFIINLTTTCYGSIISVDELCD